MIPTLDRTGAALLLSFSAVLVLLGLVVSDGFFSVDGVIYYIGAEALHNTGDLVIQNGFETFGSDDLKLVFLVEGPRGLVPQYPVGAAVTGAPLMYLFGQKALIALNVAAGIGTLFVTHALARRLFYSTEVAHLAVVLLVLCTFWTEYVVGHWPHSVSIFLVNLALWLFLVALDRDRTGLFPAFWSGVAVGVGMFFRLDTVLLLPAVAATTILFARRPVLVLAAGTAGLLPMVVLMALSNRLTFGTWNPLSYGRSGGGTDATKYLMLGLTIVLALGFLVLLRRMRTVNHRSSWIVAVAVLLALGAAGWLPLASIIGKFFGGVHTLLIDATAISDTRSGVQPKPDGTLMFWGFPKKALGQSLPWLGCLALLAGLNWGERRRSVLVVLIFFGTWSLPFVLRSWHGGLGSNMRYFLPTLPALTALSAWLILDLVKRAEGQGGRFVRLGATAAFALAALWIVVLPDRAAQMHQIGSTYLLAVIAALSLLAGFVPRPANAMAALFPIGAGLGLAAVLGFHDFSSAQFRRAFMATRSQGAAAIQGRVVFYGAPEAYSLAFGNHDHLVAIPDLATGQVDFDFVEAACRSGYRVLMPSWLAAQVLKSDRRTIELRDGPDISTRRFSEVACVR